MSELPGGWTEVSLGDLITAARAQRAEDAKLPILSMTRHEGLVDQEKRFGKRIASADTATYKVVRRGQLVVSFPINEGVIGFQEIYDEAIVSPAYKVWDVRDETILDRRYLHLYLRSPRALHYYAGKENGSTARRRSLPNESLLALPVPLPPLEEQRRIATILEHASTLEHRANRSIRTLRSMLRHQAQRFEADPELPRLPLIDLGVNFTSGKNVVGSDTDQHPSRRIIKTSAVSYGTFDPSESKPLPLEYDPPSAHRILPSDLLFTRASGSIDMIGVATFVPEIGQELFLPDKVWRTELATTSPLTLHYLYAAFLSPRFRSYVANEASGASGVRNISKMKVLRFAVPVPSYGEQQQLSVLFEKVDKHLRTLENRASSTSSLTKSLQSRAFRGEL